MKINPERTVVAVALAGGAAAFVSWLRGDDTWTATKTTLLVAGAAATATILYDNLYSVQARKALTQDLDGDAASTRLRLEDSPRARENSSKLLACNLAKAVAPRVLPLLETVEGAVPWGEKVGPVYFGTVPDDPMSINPAHGTLAKHSREKE